MRARVLLAEPVGLLDYRVPDSLVDLVRPGTPVRVPLGRRRTYGYVVELRDGPAPAGITLRDLLDVEPKRPPLPASLLELVLFAATYYVLPAGEMLTAALPAAARPGSARYRLTESGQTALSTSLGAADRALLELVAGFERGVTLTASARAIGWSRSRALRRVKLGVERGWLRIHERAKRARNAEEPRSVPPLASSFVETDAAPPTPTEEQRTAIESITAAIDEQRFATFVLQGVTGSGKTEVYLRVIAHALAHGRSALVLVPEIALTPQLAARFRQRFGERVATFHSGLTPAERRDEWERVASGGAVIGLGARSAVFLPLTEIGVVIIDEEHETSFKQDESPRYHARDLAVVRGRHEHAVVVLGSATPSLETHANATRRRYARLVLTKRVGDRPMPIVERIDLTRAERAGSGVFTVRLAEQLERTLALGEQAVLFLNRRGFAPYVQCRDCGHTYRCASCAVTLTLHQRRGILLCHYCGFETRMPASCDACQSERLDAPALGTERIETEVAALFGRVALVRLDRDTVRRRAALERELGRFARGEAKILIGTQMVAKGHDFPGVTLVGAVLADAGLNFPDFRAAERTFQLLMQVAGRAGRGDKPGLVIVQAHEPDHYAIEAASRHDYDGFAARELEVRREFDYPPFGHLALLRFEGRDEASTRKAADAAAERLRGGALEAGARVTVLGPASAPLSRLKGLWRMQVLLKARERKALRHVLGAPRPTAGRSGVREILDVDPFNML